MINGDEVFYEDLCWDWRNNKVKTSVVVVDSPTIEDETGLQCDVDNSTSSVELAPLSGSLDDVETQEEIANLSDDEAPSLKVRMLSDLYEKCTFALRVVHPRSYIEAVRLEEWNRAMREELAAIKKNKTWYLTTLPKGKKKIGLKWFFKTKFHSDGIVKRHKARLVAKGYVQEHGVDYEEVFSPVMRMETVWLLFAVNAQIR